MLIPTFFLTLFILFNIILCSINYLFIFNFTLNSGVLSLINRIYANDFYFNSLYFLWTSLWYIPIYIFVLLVLSHYNLSSINIKKVVIIIIFFFVASMTYLSYFNCNLSYLNITVFPESINGLLSNSINKVHPLLLYVSLLVFFIIFSNFYNHTLNTNQVKGIVITNNVLLIKHKTVISIYTLYLGSWWALQEGSWGGWWNWDFSEVFGLFILYKLLTTIHVKWYWRSLVNNKVHFIMSFILLIFFYLSIQLNFSYVSHNFGFRFYKFINTTILLNYLLVSILILLLFFQGNSFLKLINTLEKKWSMNQRLNDLVVTFTSSILYLSLLILVNDFIWNNFSLNLFNFQYSFNGIVFIFIYLLMLYLFHIEAISYFYIMFYQKILINFFFLIFSRMKLLNFIIILHYLLIIIFFYTLSYYENVFTNLIIIQDTSKCLKNFEIIPNTLSLENNSNIIESSTTFDNKYFVLYMYENMIVQQFYPTGFKDLLTLCIYDDIVIFVYVNFIIIFYVLVYRVNKVICFV